MEVSVSRESENILLPPAFLQASTAAIYTITIRHHLRPCEDTLAQSLKNAIGHYGDRTEELCTQQARFWPSQYFRHHASLSINPNELSSGKQGFTYRLNSRGYVEDIIDNGYGRDYLQVQ